MRKSSGYSLVEMMMTLAIGLVLVSIALPTLVDAVQRYRLDGTSQQVANLVDLTRYTAIKRNSLMTMQMVVQNGTTIFYIDLNGNGQLDANEPLVMLPVEMQLANSLPLAPKATSIPLAPTQNFTTQLTFDYRGTVNFPPGGAVAAYFLVVGYINNPKFGYRAITVTPMGQSKMWKAAASGTWAGM